MPPRRARQNTAHEPTTPSIHRRSARIGFQRDASAHPGSSQPTIVTNPIPQNGKRKQPPYDEQSSGKSKRVNITREDFRATGGRVSVPPEPRTIGPRCFRISGVPPSWSENDLFDALQTLDPPLTRNEKPSLFPACSGLTQTALLNLDSCPEHLPHAKHLQLPETTSRTGAHLTIDCDFYNLTPLNIPKGEIIADVIAVTGLAGHAFGSWRSRETKQMWLKDFLPHDVQNIRIMSYGYDSTLIGNGIAETRLLDYQRLFIQELECARTTVPKTRPMIFIGHSLGGILVLQALIEARRKRSHNHLLDALHAIVFFGTPHHGMRTYELEEMVTAGSGGCDRETSKLNLLKQLREGSEFLEVQKEELENIWAEYKPQIVSFYELIKTPTVAQLASSRYERCSHESEMVKRFSAQLSLPIEERVPVEANHTNMVKFNSAQDRTYRTVVRYLNKWVDSLFESCAEVKRLENLRHSRDHIACLESLKPSDYESFRDELLLRRHEGTCKWILGDPRYRTWARTHDDGQAILWICGDPGCGKSVLSAFLTEEIVRGKVGQLSMVYFFCDDKDERLRTAHAILVNILAQILVHIPGVIEHFLAEPAYATNKEKTPWSFGMLWRVFERIMNDANIGQVRILIDALDECEEESRTQLLKQLQYFLRDSSMGQRTKIIITSRPHIPVASYLLGITKIPLAANNLKGDITAFVEAEVQKQAQFEGSLGEEVRRALIDGANGMFLWVSLILDDLKKSANTTPRAIRMALSRLPKDLPGVYMKILRQIRVEDLETAQVILRWVVWAVRPLTLEELRIAIAIMPAEHTSISSMQDNMQTDLRQVLRLVFGPMLRIEDNNTVHLVHQSAKDFLLIRSEATEMYYSGHPSTTQCLSCAESNLQLALSCLTYLGFSECEDGPVAGNIPWEKDVRRDVKTRKQNIPFLDYAATHWPEHTKQANQNGQENQILCSAFRKLAESSRKFNLACQIRSFAMYDDFVPTPPLHIAASLGFVLFANALLDWGADINAQGDDYGNALQVAAVKGNEAVVRLLIDHGANIDAYSHYSDIWSSGCRTALQAASAMGNETVVRLLMDNSADIYAESEEYGNALQMAAAGGNENVVRLLIDCGVAINSQGGNYGSALQQAAANGNEAVVRLLIDSGADIDAYSRYSDFLSCGYRTALQAASATGNETVVRLLIDRGADINSLGEGYNGCTALQAAADSGNLAVVNLLIDRGAHINAKSEGYDCYTALHAAATGGNEAVVSLLIDRGADINAQGGFEGNALQAAIMMGHEAVVRLLINLGADVNSQAKQLGICNALEAAILKGNETVVRLLIDHGADINAKDYFGSTALDRAIQSKHQTVISLLLESSTTSHTLQDKSNDSDNICIEERPGDDSESST